MKPPVLSSAVATSVSLLGGVIVGLGLATLVDRLPFHAADQTLILLAMIPIFGGGALWGFLLTRIHRLPASMGPSIAGGLSFTFGVIGAGYLLGRLERLLVEQHPLSGLPVHVIFTLLFVPATFLVATIGGSAILLACGSRAHWFHSALMVGLAASLSFLVMDLLLDTLGRRVGAPGAAQHFTMLTVAFLGLAAAAFSAGAVLGLILSKGKNGMPAHSEPDTGSRTFS